MEIQVQVQQGPISNVEFERVQEVSLQWSMQVNILQARSDSRFYRVLLKAVGYACSYQ